MNKGLIWGLLLTVLTLGGVGTVPQASAATSSCAGVWVVVDYGSLGGTSTECATSYSSGKAALTSAGFSPTLENGMITRISDKPSNPDINKNYWSYWTATLKSDGSYSGWSYSNLGATSSHPVKGNAEGWRYQSLSGGNVAPGVTPPKGEATPKPSPTPTKTTTKPTASPKPTATATRTKKPTASPSTTSAAPTASTSSAPTSASPTTEQPAAPSTSAPTPTPTTSPADDATELGRQQFTKAEPSPADGSPVGVLVAAGLVVAGGAGVGGWWLLKGRRR